MFVDFFLFLYLLILSPKLLLKKKFYFLERLFGSPPALKGGSTIWIHAVSVGEAKAARSLFIELKKKHPDSFFVITTTTATGRDEAKRSLLGADAYLLLPFDFSWNVRRWVRKLKPTIFFLIESDFWPNLLLELKKFQTKIVLVSGKMSERSFRRFSFFSYFSKKLFSYFDFFCVQNEEQRNRFSFFVHKKGSLEVTGNLKFDLEAVPIDLPFWRQKLDLPKDTIVVASTHAPEEEEILKSLSQQCHFLVLAPRHPERFEEIAQLLLKKKIPFFRWSEPDKRNGEERVLLVDAMGRLPIIYSLSRLAIVGGSFTDKIGGHNVLEPTVYGLPVFFGPYTFRQTELVEHVLKEKIGKQVTLEELPFAIEHFFNTPSEEISFRNSIQNLALSSEKVADKTLAFIEGK